MGSGPVSRAGAAAPAFSSPAAPDGIDAGGAEPGRVARVVVDVDPRPGPFDYLVGDERVRVGSLVRVPLGGRRVRGVVIGFPDEPGSATLRPLTAVLGRGPAADAVLMALARWVAWYHVTPLPVVLRRLVGERLPAAWDPPTSLGPGYDVVASDEPPDAEHLEVAPHESGRSAVLSRQDQRRPIAVVDPLDPSHRETAMPTFHSLAVADARARLERVPLWIVGRFLGVEGMALGGGRRRRVAATLRRASWPLIEVVDRSSEPP